MDAQSPRPGPGLPRAAWPAARRPLGRLIDGVVYLVMGGVVWLARRDLGRSVR